MPKIDLCTGINEIFNYLRNKDSKMLEESSKWILPENLDKAQNNSRKIIDKGNNKNDHGGDFEHIMRLEMESILN